jgi:hypothetical protein
MRGEKTATQRTWFSRAWQKINISSTTEREREREREKRNRTLSNIWLIYSTASFTEQAGKHFNL